MDLLTVISDHSTAVLAVCIPGLLASGGYIAWKTVLGGGESAQPAPPAATRVTPRRPVAPVPAAKPRSLEAGQAEHQARGEAKTVKVAAVGPAAATAKFDDDEAKDSLFAGLSETKPAVEEKREDTSILRQAERMEELGFHNQVQKTAVSSEADNNKTEVLQAPSPAFRIPGQPPKPATEPTQPPRDPKRAETRSGEAAAAAAAPAAPANRTQTQELDDILSRIDKVLAENPVMATTTLGSASGEGTSGPKPVPPRPEDNRVESKDPKVDPKRTGDDPTAAQQKLF